MNPKAGTAHNRSALYPVLASVLKEHGLEAKFLETTSDAGSAGILAAQAAGRADLVIACGGDGTVHGVLQGMANTPTCLGVLPFGTANALARNLDLPVDPVAALRKVLTFKAHQLPLGFAETSHGNRRFLVMAGAGPDGALVHEMSQALKGRAGRAAYYAEAARVFLRRSFPAFLVTYKPMGSEHWSSLPAVAMMASRIPNLGGAFRGLTADCRLHHTHLVIKLLRAPASLSLPAWFALGRGTLHRSNPWFQTIEVDEVRCSPLDARHLPHTQIDGEPAGTLPLSVRVKPNAIRLLVPDHLLSGERSAQPGRRRGISPL